MIRLQWEIKSLKSGTMVRIPAGHDAPHDKSNTHELVLCSDFELKNIWRYLLAKQAKLAWTIKTTHLSSHEHLVYIPMNRWTWSGGGQQKRSNQIAEQTIHITLTEYEKLYHIPHHCRHQTHANVQNSDDLNKDSDVYHCWQSKICRRKNNVCHSLKNRGDSIINESTKEKQ